VTLEQDAAVLKPWMTKFPGYIAGDATHAHRDFVPLWCLERDPHIQAAPVDVPPWLATR
jgi:hypothetical protein